MIRLKPGMGTEKRTIASKHTIALPTTQLSAQSKPTQETESSIELGFSVPAFVAWVSITSLAVYRLTTQPSPDLDAAILQEFLRDPVHPNLNPLFFFVFNCFVPIPALCALLSLQTRPQRSLPAWPFLAASLGAGFFALGPYLTLRDNGNAMDNSDPSPSKLVVGGLLAFALYLPVASGLWQVTDWSSVLQEYRNMAATTNLVALSSVDLVFLHTTVALLVAQDAQERSRDSKWGPVSFFLPMVGPCLYLLTNKEEN